MSEIKTKEEQYERYVLSTPEKTNQDLQNELDMLKLHYVNSMPVYKVLKNLRFSRFSDGLESRLGIKTIGDLRILLEEYPDLEKLFKEYPELKPYNIGKKSMQYIESTMKDFDKNIDKYYEIFREDMVEIDKKKNSEMDSVFNEHQIKILKELNINSVSELVYIYKYNLEKIYLFMNIIGEKNIRSITQTLFFHLKFDKPKCFFDIMYDYVIDQLKDIYKNDSEMLRVLETLEACSHRPGFLADIIFFGNLSVENTTLYKEQYLNINN